MREKFWKGPYGGAVYNYTYTKTRPLFFRYPLPLPIHRDRGYTQNRLPAHTPPQKIARGFIGLRKASLSPAQTPSTRQPSASSLCRRIVDHNLFMSTTEDIVLLYLSNSAYIELFTKYERNKIDIWLRSSLKRRFRASKLDIDRQLSGVFAVICFIDHLAAVEILLIGEDRL